MAGLELIPIERNGNLRGFDGVLPDVTRDVLRATASMYDAVGFQEPWIGYLAVESTVVVGACGFKTPPRSGRVEIAYFTFPGNEGRGVATAMAAKLLQIAAMTKPGIRVIAQTLPERSASHRVLEKLGFQQTGTVDHPEDGVVVEWLTC
jgi:RimJ/RimL family protein N-acetyltransferase